MTDIVYNKNGIAFDIDNIATDLNGKVDVDLSNLSNGLTNTICTTAATTVSTASSATPAVIVENYSNDTSWYRVYSDGWCEQGGIITAHNTLVNLLKEYNSTNYIINATSIHDSLQDGYNAYVGYVTTSSFYLYNKMYGSDVATPVCWQASGYIS